MPKIRKTRYESILAGKLSRGCRQCVDGKKSVFFVTGLCPRRCSYCPISDSKKDKDVTYINEWETKKEKDIISEIRLCNSKGIGITGGDPLSTIERTVKYIKLLKDTFGKGFHIHLYTSFDLVTLKHLKMLHYAGLDEIRFHPDFKKESQWKRIMLADKFDWVKVVEIPAIPEDIEYVKKFLLTYYPFIDYLNLNELEYADNEFSDVGEKYTAKDSLSYAVKGSEKTALNIMDYALSLGINNVHFCTATLKDKYQLARRIKRRAKGVSRPFDKVTSEGMLIRGAIYHDRFLSHSKATPRDIQKAKKIRDFLISLGVKEKMVYVDTDFGRVLTSVRMAKKHAETLKKKRYHTYIVEEYPTKDAFPIEIEEL